LWNDTRSAAAAAQLSAEVADIVQRTGSRPVASFTSTKLRWLVDTEPENASRLAAVVLPHDWLTWRLRGFGPENPRLDALTTDRSDASGTGYFDPATGEYDLELLRVILRRESISDLPILPRIVVAGGCAGSMPIDRSVRERGVLVGPGAGYNAGAALGLGAAVGDVVVSI
jgi:xylulokinase